MRANLLVDVDAAPRALRLEAVELVRGHEHRDKHHCQ